MKKIRSRRPSPSMVVAIAAVVLSCAGSATAARVITGRQIKNNSVTSSDVRNNSLRSRDVRNRSLLAKDFKLGQLPRGAQGPRGLTGPTGPRGPGGFGALRYAFVEDNALADGDSGGLAADCPSGTFPTGGDALAYNADTGDDTPDVITNQGIDFGAPDGGPSGWFADFANNIGGGTDADVFVDVICANANSVAPAATVKRFRSRGRLHR